MNRRTVSDEMGINRCHDFEIWNFIHNHFSILEFQSQQQCSTPDRRRGSCVDLRQCPALYNLIRKPNISFDERNFLRQSQCAYLNNYPWVINTADV